MLRIYLIHFAFPCYYWYIDYTARIGTQHNAVVGKYADLFAVVYIGQTYHKTIVTFTYSRTRKENEQSLPAFHTQSLALGIEANNSSPIFLISNFLILPLPVIGI
jgi:hypothetical protein